MGRADEMDSSVVGISVGPIASHVIAHKASLTKADLATFKNELGPPILAATIVALTVDPRVFEDPTYLRGVRAIIVEEDAELLFQMQQVCASLGMDVIAASTLTSADLKLCYEKKPQFILSGTQDTATSTVLRKILAPRGHLMLWNHPTEGFLPIAASEPWNVGYALKRAAAYKGKPSATYCSPTSLLPELPVSVSRSQDLFDPENAYLLVGGIGSLGLHMALWMYEVGSSVLLRSHPFKR